MASGDPSGCASSPSTDDAESRYFELDLDSLRAIGAWAADCAERVLPLYEAGAEPDPRPRAALDGIREFAAGGKRTARLRTLALAAHAAAREVDDPAASAAARAAGVAAAVAYTHPLADVQQTKHVVGAAAYAALAFELAGDGGPGVAEAEVRRAIGHAPAEAGEVLRQMPAREPGKGRLATLMYELDAGIRARAPLRIVEAAAEDLVAVLEVEHLAFGGDDVADLVRELTDDPTAKPVLSLLAWDGDRPVGHIMFTAVRLQGASEDVVASILAPLAVVPDAQRTGIGARLIAEGVRRQFEAGVDLVFVLGHPDYYPRHGFEPARRLGLWAPYPVSPEEAWMVRARKPDVLGRVRGTVICADAMNRPEHWRE